MKKNQLFFYFFLSFVFSFTSLPKEERQEIRLFANRFPPDVIVQNTNTYLKVENTVDHDIIVCIQIKIRNT